MERTAGERGCLISLLALFLLLLFIWNRCGREEFKNSSFDGIVSKIRYGDKQTPIVEIDSIEHVIPSVKGDVLIGDSLVKRKGSFVVTQFRDGERINKYTW